MLIVYYLYLLFLIADSFNRYIITVRIDTTKLEDHGRVHLFILIDFSETIISVVVIFSNSLMCSIYFFDKEPLLIFCCMWSTQLIKLYRTKYFINFLIYHQKIRMFVDNNLLDGIGRSIVSLRKQIMCIYIYRLVVGTRYEIKGVIRCRVIGTLIVLIQKTKYIRLGPRW